MVLICTEPNGEFPSSLQVKVEHRYDSASLEHCHPSTDKSGGVLTATVCDYSFYDYMNSSIPNYAPTYEGAKDISCKMISEDKIAAELGKASVDMKSPEVMSKCGWLNSKAIETAKALLSKDWPRAVQRFEAQGKKLVFKEDSHAFMGPQWVLTGLDFKESAAEVEITSEALVSPLDSHFYPGNHYCKLLAPSKAVELIMTRGLTQRYSGTAAEQARPIAEVLV